MEELLGRGTVTGLPEEVVAGKTGHPSMRSPFVPKTTKNAYDKAVDFNTMV